MSATLRGHCWKRQWVASAAARGGLFDCHEIQTIKKGLAVEYLVLAIVAIIGGGIVGWTSAHNMDNNPLDTPMIFHKIDPLFFIGFGFILPAIVGFKMVGFLGIIVALVIVWLSSVVIGSGIHKNK